MYKRQPVIGVKACGVVGNVMTSPLSGAYPHTVLLTPLLVEERNSIPTKGVSNTVWGYAPDRGCLLYTSHNEKHIRLPCINSLFGFYIF